MIRAVLLIGLISVGGCSRFSADEYLDGQRQLLIQEGKARDYAEGYVDGCATARHLLGDKRFQLQKQISRFEVEPPYARGWEQGAEQCRHRLRPQPSKPRQKAPTVESIEIEKENAAMEAERHRLWDELKK